MFDYYQDKTYYTDDSLQTIPSIDLLYSEIIWRIESNQPKTAVRLIHHNIETVIKNINRELIANFIEILLNNNDWKLANKLFSASVKNGKNKSVAVMQLYFASYDAQQRNWSQVHKRLKNNLQKINRKYSDYAYLLYGSSLMHRKKHKLAIKYFNKIPATSRYYTYAQLNTAMEMDRSRQRKGVIDKISHIKGKYSIEQPNKPRNRLNLLLGYSLFKRQQFNKAIDVLKSIKINSRYENRALLGIGLCSIKINKYNEGAFYFSLLKNKKVIDLSVDESYLLISYLYEKQQQGVAAAVSYESAINYYSKRLKQLNNILPHSNDISSIGFDESTASIIIRNTSFDYNKHFPESFMHKYKMLNDVLASSKNKHLKTKINKALKKYRHTLSKIAKYLVAQRKIYLRSYISQARYGLASYYDNRGN